eukprot:1720765-Pleurochrysis_carterae.AAC.2
MPAFPGIRKSLNVRRGLNVSTCGAVPACDCRQISLRNPSHVALELSALQLQCTHVPAEPPTTEASSNAPVEASSALVEASSALVEADKVRVDAEAFELDAHELSLAAGKRSLLQLGVRPMREGARGDSRARDTCACPLYSLTLLRREHAVC